MCVINAWLVYRKSHPQEIIPQYKFRREIVKVWLTRYEITATTYIFDSSQKIEEIHG